MTHRCVWVFSQHLLAGHFENLIRDISKNLGAIAGGAIASSPFFFDGYQPPATTNLAISHQWREQFIGKYAVRAKWFHARSPLISAHRLSHVVAPTIILPDRPACIALLTAQPDKIVFAPREVMGRPNSMGIAPRSSFWMLSSDSPRSTRRSMPPSDYMNEIELAVGKVKLEQLLNSHLLPDQEDSPLLEDGFEAFLGQRQRLIIQQIEEATA